MTFPEVVKFSDGSDFSEVSEVSVLSSISEVSNVIEVETFSATFEARDITEDTEVKRVEKCIENIVFKEALR